MSFQVGFVCGGELMEARCLHDILQHAAHVSVDVGDVERTVLHALHNLVGLLLLPRLQQVVAGMHLIRGLQSLANANPVGHHDALIPPVVAQDLREQVVVSHRVLTVDLVV